MNVSTALLRCCLKNNHFDINYFDKKIELTMRPLRLWR